MSDRREEDLTRTWSDALDDEVRLRIVLTGDPRSEGIRSFAEKLRAVAPRVRVSLENGTGSDAPAILVGNQVRYHAAPTGTELAPFLEAAQRFGAVGARADRLARNDVRVYVAPQCPHCPGAVRELFRLLEGDTLVTLTVVDAELCPEMAASDGVRSVPTVIAGRHYRSTGIVSIEEIRGALAGAPPDGPMLDRMLDGGEAEGVAVMMADAGEVFPSVLDRLAHPAMSVRLGAMAALERLVESAPGAARTAEAGLWERIARASREATGDLLYMIGEVGTAGSVPRLEAFLESTADDDLREAATDALARIAGRTQD